MTFIQITNKLGDEQRDIAPSFTNNNPAQFLQGVTFLGHSALQQEWDCDLQQQEWLEYVQLEW